MRGAVGYFSLVAGICLLLAAAGTIPASADPNSPGNNGTITTTTTPGAVGGSASTGVVADVQSAPLALAVAGVENLPSTNTDTGRAPLVALGTVIFAAGIALLRRSTVVPTE